MKKLNLLAMYFLCSSVFAQKNIEGQPIPYSSSFFSWGDRNAVKVTFSSTDEGTPTPIKWGMDTAWDDEGNVLRGVNFIGKDNLTYGRVSFQVMDKVNADGTLSDRQIGYLRSRLQHISHSAPEGILLNSDPVDINVEAFTHHPEEWYKVIKATAKYVMDYGLKVVSIAPFNEPDVTASNQGTKDDFKAVAKLIKEDPFFDGIRICAGNTCNNDGAMEWYDHMKPYVDEGNTHQLAGDFDHYADFYTHVKADGNVATNDELHNVMEGIVGAQYGMENGIWWGSAGPTRGDFCIATTPGGSRLGYAENRNAWTGAAVYRMPDGRIKGFAGSSERQAFPCTYEYVSTNKPVYFDGHGPFYSYEVELPGGFRYGDEYQQSAEKNVRICQGEDVPVCPLTNGNYIIVNKKSQKVLTIASGSTENSAPIVQYTERNYNYQQWTLEALTDNGGDLSGYYIHSLRSAFMNIETGGFQVKEGATVSVYTTTKGENQRWAFEYAGDGYYKIRNYQSGLYLEVVDGSTSNNANVRLCANATEDHQLWKFLPIDADCEKVAPAVPTGLKATPQQHSVLLKWDENTQDKDFNGFMVLRGVKNQNGEVEYDVIGRNIMMNSFIDNDCRENTTYYYAVQSVDYSQNRSAKSESVVAAASGDKGLVAWYDFERNASDQSENILNSVIAGNSKFVSGRFGKSALQLDGISNYVRIPASAVNLSQITIAVWIYNSGIITENSHLFDFGSDATRNAYLSLNQGGEILMTLKNGEQKQTISAGELSEGWHHIALTIGAETTTIYVDGEAKGTATPTAIRLSDIKPVCNYMGCGQDNSTPLMNGYVDDLRIYNYALTATEINELIESAGTVTEEEDAWVSPVAPGKALQELGTTDVYLYNVDADAFVTYGMDWNAKALAQRLSKGDKSLDNRFRVKIHKLSGNKIQLSMVDKPNVYIGCIPDACNVWCDRADQSEAVFTYQEVPTPSGYIYVLTSEAQNDVLDVTYAYGGPLTTRNGRGFIHWAFITPQDIYTTQAYAKYKERKCLYDIRQAIVNSDKEADYVVEIQEAGLTYNNPNATTKELRAAARKLLLAVATDLKTSVDATILFDNADMLGNNTTANWTKTATTIADGDIEVYHKPFTLTQTKTDLPNGIYDVVFHAFYRNDGSDKAPIVSATTSATISENLIERKTVHNSEVLMNTNENTAGAAQVLTSDKAQTVLKGIIVDNHEMTLSVDVSSSSQWVNFQGFELVYRQPLVVVEVPNSGYTTFYYSNQSFLLPEGMEAFTIKETSEGFLVSQHFTTAGTVLQAGQAVVLKASPGNYTMIPTTEKKAKDTRNKLRGSDEDELTRGGDYYYTLSEDGNGQAAWNWVATDGATFVNPAHKAYLVADKDIHLPSISIDTITSISIIQAEGKHNPDAIYNLAGQRVDEAYPFIKIKGGKKILPKK
ncbi:MAG: RICIN domain-containing protein [Paraprevotella sp.]|nr:RICIN domain-containing protein [Paraprevotella sp.]